MSNAPLNAPNPRGGPTNAPLNAPNLRGGPTNAPLNALFPRRLRAHLLESKHLCRALVELDHNSQALTEIKAQWLYALLVLGKHHSQGLTKIKAQWLLWLCLGSTTASA